MSSSLLALATLGPYALVAQPQTDNVAAGWLDRATLTGDWGGARSSMEGRGINFSAHFVTESATNPIGGLRQTARYTQQIDFGFDLDLSRLAGDPGGKIQILLLDRAGRSLSADAIGNQFAVQELYGAGQNFRLVELSYEQSMFANKLSFQLGWAPSWKLLRFAAGLLRFPKWLHLCARDAYDNQQRCSQLSRRPMGGHMKVEPTREFYIQSGIFQVNPNEGNSDRGFDLSLGSTGVFIPLRSDGFRGEILDHLQAFIAWGLTIIPQLHPMFFRMFMGSLLGFLVLLSRSAMVAGARMAWQTK
jgi:porin